MSFNSTQFKEIKINNFNPSNKEKVECQKCGSIIKKPRSKFVQKCNVCNAVTEFFAPTPFQQVIMSLKNRILLVAGGFGSGKTTADAKKIQEHVLTTPYAQVACFAQTKEQLFNNFKDKALNQFFLDEWFVKGKKNMTKWKLRNGSEILFVMSNDQQKIRSASYTMAIMVEASKAQLYEVYQQLKTRLRDAAAVKYKLDDNGNPIFEEDEEGNKRQVVLEDTSQLIIETNPTELWPKTQVLLKTQQIYHTSTVYGIPDLMQRVIPGKEDVASIISATVDNPILTKEFIESIKGDNPEWKIRRDVYGDFSDKNRLIFGDLLNNIVEPFPIPHNWPRYLAVDPGIQDKFAGLWAAIDPVHRIVYFYEEFYEDNVLINEVVDIIRQKESQTGTTNRNMMIRLIDPKAKARQFSKEEYTTVQSLLEEYGIDFELARKSGDKKADILAAQTMVAKGDIKVFSSLVNFRWELAQYAWGISKDESSFEEKVPTKFDHLIDCLRYLIMEWPQLLSQLDLGEFNQKIYSSSQRNKVFGPMIGFNNSNRHSNSGNFFTA